MRERGVKDALEVEPTKTVFPCIETPPDASLQALNSRRRQAARYEKTPQALPRLVSVSRAVGGFRDAEKKNEKKIEKHDEWHKIRNGETYFKQ